MTTDINKAMQNVEKINEFARELEPIYRLFNWKWYVGGELMTYPSSKEISNTIHRLAKDAKKHGEASTGGLTVIADLNEKDEGMFLVKWNLDKSLYFHT